jgi:hypothetical protein
MTEDRKIENAITQMARAQRSLAKKVVELERQLANSWTIIRQPQEGEPVVYVGVHAVDWKLEFGEPTVGFIQTKTD